MELHPSQDCLHTLRAIIINVFRQLLFEKKKQEKNFLNDSKMIMWWLLGFLLIFDWNPSITFYWIKPIKKNIQNQKIIRNSFSDKKKFMTLIVLLHYIV